MPQKTEYRITLAEDARTATLALALDGEVVGSGVFEDAASLDGFIALLGAVRAAMNDRVPEKLDPSPRLQTTENPNWWVYDPKPEGHMMALRHPGFGWLGFVLPEPSAVSLAGWLLRPCAEPLKTDDAKVVGANLIGVERYSLGRDPTGRPIIGLQPTGGGMIFYVFGAPEARAMARAVLKGVPAR